jgi:hypothetical protein
LKREARYEVESSSCFHMLLKPVLTNQAAGMGNNPSKKSSRENEIKNRILPDNPLGRMLNGCPIIPRSKTKESNI